MRDRNHERNSVILAALLHDIGKFAQRAREELGGYDRSVEQYCCPMWDGRYTHTHVLYSGKFCRVHLTPYWPMVENLVLYHHAPGDIPNALPETRQLSKFITLADWLSAGERRGRPEEEPTGDAWNEPLISIFSQVQANGKNKRDLFCPLSTLATDLSGLFPVPEKKNALSTMSYLELWTRFVEEVDKIEFGESFDLLCSQLLSVLEKYTLFVPAAAYRDKPDLSLFHHLKVTAAIAACLYDLGLSENDLDSVIQQLMSVNKSEKADVCPVCFFVKGDVSGIQDFIYSVTSQKALKGLRGRSLYLQLLSDAMARTILRDFDLPPTNLVLAAGGHIHLLVPAVQDAEKKLTALIEYFNRVLIQSHRGRIAVVFAWEPLLAEDFAKDRFINVWEKLGAELAREKKRKFSSLVLQSDYRDAILGPFEEGGERKACEICGGELAEDGESPCSLCGSFAELAYALSRSSVLEIEQCPAEKSQTIRPARKWFDVLRSLGWQYWFREMPEDITNSYILNSVDFLSDKRLRGTLFIARHTALDASGNVATLEHLSDQSKGIHKWGVLRADVDNLGKLFEKGLGEDKTLSRVSMLSYLVSLFFTLQIENISKSKEYRDKVYVAYSGGDDLFIVGSWSVLPDLAAAINDAFRSFTCQNLTLSCGIFIAPSSKFPIYEAAFASGNALDTAKRTEGKNRVSFFEKDIDWVEFQKIRIIKDQIVGLLNSDIPRSLLSVVSSSSIEKELAAKKIIPMERIWRLLYAFKRLKERHKDYSEHLTDLEHRIVTDHILLSNVDLAVRWADYLTRKDGESDGV